MHVKPVPLRLALLTLGCAERDTPAAGRLIGVEGKTVRRALAGAVVSEKFIANFMAVCRLNTDRLEQVGLEISTDEFFEHRAAVPETSAAA